MKKKIVFIVEKTGTGFSPYAEDDNIPASTSADNMTELRIKITLEDPDSIAGVSKRYRKIHCC